MTTELKVTISAAQDSPYFLVRVLATILDNFTPSMLLNNPLIPALPSHSQLKIVFWFAEAKAIGLSEIPP